MAVNVEPRPSVLSTDTWPPSKVASLRTRGSPRPVPRTRLCTGLSSWVNSSKMRSWSSAAMPIPVSATEQTTDAPSGGQPGGHPDLAALGELQRVRDEVAQDLRRPCPRRCAGAARRRAPRTRGPPTRCTSSGRSMPRRAPKRFLRSNSAGRTTVLPASTFARSSRSFTSSDRSSAALRMKPTCRACSAVSGPSRSSSRSARQRQDRVQRRAELVAHVRQEARLQLVGAPQVIGLLVELGVERDDAAVGVLQLAVEARPAPPGAARSSLERAEQLLVLLADLRRMGLCGAACASARASARRRSAASSAGARRERQLADQSRSSPRRTTMSISNRSIRRRAPTMPSPMPVGDRYSPERIGVDVGDPRPAIAHADHEDLRRVLPSTRNSTAPPRAYMKALRAISETAVAMRVWSWPSKPSSRRDLARVLADERPRPARSGWSMDRRGTLMRPARARRRRSRRRGPG